MRSTLCLGVLLSVTLLALPAHAGPLDDTTPLISTQAGLHAVTKQGFVVEDDGEPLVLQVILWSGAGTNVITFTGPSGQTHEIRGPALFVAMAAESHTVDAAPEPGHWSVAIETTTGATTYEMLVHH